MSNKEAGLSVVILGMHRSGTSSLAGSLEEAGLYLGDVQTSNPWNPKGNREDLRIMRLNDDVLAESGGSWDRPPQSVIWSAEHHGRRDEIIAGFDGHDPWGFKDPRTLLTIDGWLEGLPNFALVGSFRDPVAVAESLERRGGGERSRWVELWITYNTRLLDLHRRFGFPLVDFDLDPAAYGRRVADVATGLGMSEPDTGAFFDVGLRHERSSPDELPEQALDLLAELRSAAA